MIFINGDVMSNKNPILTVETTLNFKFDLIQMKVASKNLIGTIIVTINNIVIGELKIFYYKNEESLTEKERLQEISNRLKKVMMDKTKLISIITTNQYNGKLLDILADVLIYFEETEETDPWSNQVGNYFNKLFK